MKSKILKTTSNLFSKKSLKYTIPIILSIATPLIFLARRNVNPPRIAERQQQIQTENQQFREYQERLRIHKQPYEIEERIQQEIIFNRPKLNNIRPRTKINRELQQEIHPKLNNIRTNINREV